MSLSFGSVTDFYGDDFGLSTDELVKKQMKKEKPVVQPVIKPVIQPIVQPSTRMPHNNIFTSNDFKENFGNSPNENKEIIKLLTEILLLLKCFLVIVVLLLVIKIFEKKV